MESLVRPGRQAAILVRNRLGASSILRNQDIPCRHAQTGSDKIVTTSPFKFQESWYKRLMHKAGLGEANVFALRRASVFHYQACTDKLDVERYFSAFKLPDTMFSFFLVAQMHVWMCQARSMKEGGEGRILRNEILERMWQDIDVRIGRLDVFTPSKRKSIVNDLLFHHQSAILSYDEGLLTDDKVLAGAIWRTMYSKDHVEPEVLELAVRYVRTQMDHLKSISARDWCLDGKFDWAPFPPLTT